MTIISPQTSCSSISSNTDTITITNSVSASTYWTGTGIGGSSGTITISNGGSSGSGYTISSGFSQAVNGGVLSGAGTSDYIWQMPEEFVDAFPDFERIQSMCKKYPGLKIAYEKFVTTYRLVKDDYDNPTDET